jgi:hypothetical protein
VRGRLDQLEADPGEIGIAGAGRDDDARAERQGRLDAERVVAEDPDLGPQLAQVVIEVVGEAVVVIDEEQHGLPDRCGGGRGHWSPSSSTTWATARPRWPPHGRLPGPLTLAFLPYADSTAAMLETAAATRFELMLHLPMEPLGDANPGPEALWSGSIPTSCAGGCAGRSARCRGPWGSTTTWAAASPSTLRGLEIVMDELRRHGSSSSTAGPIRQPRRAARPGRPACRRAAATSSSTTTRSLGRSPGSLALLERIAERHGNAIAIGHPYPTTLAALEAWLPSLEGRGFRLARVSEVIAAAALRPKVSAWEPVRPGPPSRRLAMRPSCHRRGRSRTLSAPRRAVAGISSPAGHSLIAGLSPSACSRRHEFH